MKEYIIDKNQENKRLDKFLKMVLPKAPDSFIYKMLRKKNIKLNSSKADGSEKLKIGDIINIYLSDDTFDSFQNSNEITKDYIRAYETLKNIKIIYEDDDVLIVYKPQNILSQKAKSNDLSLNEWIIGYLLNNNIINIDSLRTFKPSILNRLDRNTNGLVIGAKTLKASQEISYLIKERKIKKFYEAIVIGKIDKEILLKGYLSKDENLNKVKVYDIKPQNVDSDYIETKIVPIEYNNDFTTLEIELITGKTHQIRAHLASINHPILGDGKYGNININKKNNVFMQELCAKRLEFPGDCKINSLKNKVVSL